MPSEIELSLAEEFDAPALRSRLDALLLLARSIRTYLKELFRETELDRSQAEWHQVVDILAKIFADQIHTLTDSNELLLIWKQFTSHNVIARLHRGVKQVLDSIENDIEASLKSPRDCIGYLVQTNRRAARFVSDLVRHHNLVARARDVQAIPIFIHFDDNARLFCASSTRRGNQISWGLQLKEHSLHGALIAELIFEHEYFSHVLPNNTHLSNNIREIWLTVALLREHVNITGDNSQNHIDQFLWEKFRIQLATHFHASADHLFGPRRLDFLAIKIHFRFPEIFWRLTATILNLGDSWQKAKLVDGVLLRLAGLPDRTLREVLTSKWRDWAGLARQLEAVSY